MKRVLIFGGTGFIGYHLINGLLKEKKEITLFLRKESNIKRIKPFLGKVKIIQGNLHNPDEIEEAIKKADVVYHLAAIINRRATWELYKKVNIELSKSIFEKASKHKKRVIYISSLSVMGGTKEPHIYTEEDKPHPVAKYGRSKWEAEKIANHYIKTRKGRITILRPPAVYGEEDNFDRGFIKIIHLTYNRKFPVIGNLENYMSLVYVKNLVDIMLTVPYKRKTIGETYFVADKEILKSIEILNYIVKLLNAPPPIKIPFWIAKGATQAIEIFSKITGYPVPFPENFVNDVTSNYACSINKITNDTGWKPKFSIYNGLKRTVNWYLKLLETGRIKDYI